MYASHICASLAFVFITVCAVLMLASLSMERWVEMTSQITPPLRAGLVTTCIGSSCGVPDYGTFSACGRTASDIALRFRVMFGLEVAAAFFAVIASVVCVCSAVAQRDSLGNTVENVPEGNGRDLAPHCRNGPPASGGCVLLSAACCAAVLGLFRDSYVSWANCGQSICDAFVKNINPNATVVSQAAPSCDVSYSYYLVITAGLAALMAALLCVVWMVLLSNAALAAATALEDRTISRTHRDQLQQEEEKRKQEKEQQNAPYGGGGASPKREAPPAEQPAASDDDAADDFIEVDDPNNGGAAVAGDDDTALPEGCWERYDGSLYWSAELGYFFDVASACYYNPVHELWFNPETDAWFYLDDNGHSIPAAAPDGGLHSNERHQLYQATPPALTPSVTPRARD